MGKQKVCGECGANLENDGTCQELFHQMLYWEADNPKYGEVHHLAVLSYYLQHPSLYSTAGLKIAKRLLGEFLEEGITPQAARARLAANLDFGEGKPKITAAGYSIGAYKGQVRWRMTAADVVAGGATSYLDNVRKWSRSLLETLKATNNI